MARPFGKLYSGVFGGIRPVTKGDGTEIDGFFRLQLTVPSRHEEEESITVSATFSRANRDGTPTHVGRQLDALADSGALVLGETELLVKVTERRNEKGYTNTTAVSVATWASLVEEVRPQGNGHGPPAAAARAVAAKA